MDKRREQVELFRRTDCQIMITTDAGGESINLQFCNQLINYDIPWNPNKLEQRMGRIHRIGQKNEVFVFNMVAKNTREGSVMARLLDKMEQMRTDLGSDLVYDFIGEVLEDNFDSMASLMQEAIIDRENLDDIIANMEKTLSNENNNLLKLVEEERLVEDEIDLKDLKRDTNSWRIERIPRHSYSDFVTYILEKKRVRINKSNDNRVLRIERLPKFIRDQMFEVVEEQTESYRYTNSIKNESEQVPLITDIHPLFQIAMDLMKKEIGGQSWNHLQVIADVPEQLNVEIYEIGIMDGTGLEVERKLIHFAKRANDKIIILNKNWIFQHLFKKVALEEHTTHTEISVIVMEHALKIRNDVLSNREDKLNKMQMFLEKTFNQQYRETLERLETYRQENVDNRNSALINQMNARLIDLDMKKSERIQLINQQKNVAMKPPKRIMSLELIPMSSSNRMIAEDYYDLIVNYEKENGRLNVRQYDNLGMIDFTSERFNGEERFIILTNDPNFEMKETDLEELGEIIEYVHVYYVNQYNVLKEWKVTG